VSKDYYALLGIPPSASAAEVKVAFRQLIAKYHPDKVQHLGAEFQTMAVDRAAELTEAYRVLSHAQQRAAYDLARAAIVDRAAVATAPPPAWTEPAGPREGDVPRREAFTQERASRDEFVRKAIVGRLRQAINASIAGQYEELPARGFDVACVPKAKLFGRGRGPRLLGRFVSAVDGHAVADAWAHAGKWGAESVDEICVFLLGSALAPRRELEDAVAEQRRRRSRGAKVIMIPIDARNWDAYVPIDAPPVAKTLLDRLRNGR